MILKKQILFFLLSISFYQAVSQSEDNAWSDYIALYQKIGSKHVGGNCRMTPSCSNYGMLQFKSNNPISAFILTSDRLLRCSHDMSNYTLTMTKDSYRMIDYPTKEENDKAKPKWSEINFAYADSLELIKTSNSFISYLMNHEQYSEALMEINRVIFEHKESELPVDIFVNYLRCRRSLEKYDHLILDYQTIVPRRYQKTPLILMEVARTWLALRNYTKTLEVIEEIHTLKNCPPIIREEASIVASICYSREFNWKEAQKALTSITPKSKYHSNVTEINQHIDLGLQFKPKKTWIAGVLSIVPGGGYLYTKHPSSALSAFLINGLLAYATFTSFQSGNTGMGILTSVMGFGFYTGNIQGSVNSVKRYNQINQERISNKINLQFSY
ncbi:membrane protein insertion efficiency factor YidD [Aquirufa sp. ROCK2-A2]